MHVSPAARSATARNGAGGCDTVLDLARLRPMNRVVLLSISHTGAAGGVQPCCTGGMFDLFELLCGSVQAGLHSAWEQSSWIEPVPMGARFPSIMFSVTPLAMSFSE